MPEVKDLFDLIQKSNNILVLIDKVSTKKEISLLSLLLKLLVSENKKYDILSISNISQKTQTLLKESNIEIAKELKPSEYIITIDYGSSQVDKIVYDTDKENGKLIFKILPSSNGFNFDKVEFTEGGNKFDSVICVGILEPKDLGDFYDKNEYLFKECSFFKFNNFDEIPSTFSRGNIQIQPELFDQLMSATLEDINLIEGSPETDKVTDFLNLAANGGSIGKAISKKYYSKASNHIDLYRVILNNVEKQNANRVIYSTVLKKDIEELGISREDLEDLGRIPFNISDEFDLAFIFFEISEKEVCVVVESNNIESFSAQTIAGVFGGSGDKGHAVCVVDTTIDEMDKRFLSVLKDLYNIDISLTNKVLVVDNSTNKLTKARKYSKNKGLIK